MKIEYDSKILQIFKVEADEYTAEIRTGLSELEKEPGRAEAR